MSLEVAIQENTAAVREMSALMAKLFSNTGLAAPAGAKEPKEKKPAAKAAEVQATAPAADAPETKAESSAPALVYDDVKGPFLKLVGTKRDAAVAILKQFGAAKLSDVKPENFAAVLAAVQAA